jgi:plasmid stabilization system protein ParE
MKVRYTKRAFADREKIFDYLDQRHARAGVGLIRQRIVELGEQDKQGRHLCALGYAVPPSKPNFTPMAAKRLFSLGRTVDVVITFFK